MPTSKYDWSKAEPPERFIEPPVRVRLSGPLACFTRPEHKAERVSYPVITPTAAAGVLESVFWKPEFQYVITCIDVLAPVAWTTLRTNETGAVIVPRSTGIDTAANRQQRMSLLLRDVVYRVHAHVLVHPDAEHGNAAKFRDQLRRRVEKGQAFRTPSLGMREMIADVDVDDPTEPPVNWTEDLGPMLHSIRRDQVGQETYGWFPARVDAGRLVVPAVAPFETGPGRAAA